MLHREAAVGAQPGVVLDAAVEEFYQGPEIGLIRVKEVGSSMGDLSIKHGGFARKDQHLPVTRQLE